MNTYNCIVYAKGFGTDTYTVVAPNLFTARIELLDRLKNETDIPLEDWEVLEIVEESYFKSIFYNPMTDKRKISKKFRKKS